MKEKLLLGILGLLLLAGLSTATAYQPLIKYDKHVMDSSYNGFNSEATSKLVLNLTTAYTHILYFRFYDENLTSVGGLTINSTNYPEEILFSSINPTINYMNFDVQLTNGLFYSVGSQDLLIPTTWGIKLTTGGNATDPTMSVTAGL